MGFRYYEKTLSEWAQSNWWPEIKKLRLPVSDSVFTWLYEKAGDNDLNGAGREDYNCVVVFDNVVEKPIAIAMYYLYDNKNIEFMVFVDEGHRRQKLGTRLFSRIKKKTKPSGIVVYPHDYTSNEFYHKTYPKHFIDNP